jgi:hypothetical protein
VRAQENSLPFGEVMSRIMEHWFRSLLFLVELPPHIVQIKVSRA